VNTKLPTATYIKQTDATKKKIRRFAVTSTENTKCENIYAITKAITPTNKTNILLTYFLNI